MAQYINKDALVEEIENLENTYKKCPTYNSYEEGLKDGRLIGYKDALYKIDTLEVKEMDLEEEIDNQIRLLCGVHTIENKTNWYKGPYSELIVFAEHFFELGMTVRNEAQKGE